MHPCHNLHSSVEWAGQLTNERNQHEAKQPTWRTKNARLASTYALNVIYQSKLSTSIRWSNHLEQHRERSQRRRHLRHALRNHREHNVPLDNTALAHDSLRICTSPVTGKHIHDNTTTTGVVSTVQKESILFNAFSTSPHSSRSRRSQYGRTRVKIFHLNSREKSAGCLRAIQELSNASENAVRTSAAHVS